MDEETKKFFGDQVDKLCDMIAKRFKIMQKTDVVHIEEKRDSMGKKADRNLS